MYYISLVAKGSRPCTQECCEVTDLVGGGSPDSANSKYILSCWWLTNILIIAHIFSSLMLSPLSMPSLSISNAVSPGLSSPSLTRRHFSQFSIKSSSKDVRWKTDDPITQELQTSSKLRGNSAQRWSVKYWTCVLLLCSEGSGFTAAIVVA